MTEPRPLHCFYDGSDRVIAHNPSDADVVWASVYGGVHDDDLPWVTEDGDTSHTITTTDGPKGANYTQTLTVREWIAENGRGFLSSENI